jgi:hypothetical protein
VRDMDSKFASAVLAVRATRARRCGGLVKVADWKEQIQQLVARLKNPGVDIKGSFGAGGGGGGEHWKNVGMESLRNALIGAGVGGVGGAASSLFSRRRKKQPLNRAVRGALIGGTMGGLGTAAYRGGEYLKSPVPAAEAKGQLSWEQSLANQRAIAESQGIPFVEPQRPGPPAPPAPGGAGAPKKDSLIESLLNEAGSKVKGVGAAISEATNADEYGRPRATVGETAKNIGKTLVGDPSTWSTPVPAGALVGGTVGAGALPFSRMMMARWNLGTMLSDPAAAQARGLPSDLVRRGGRWRRMGRQFEGVSGSQARAARNATRRASGLRPRGLTGRSALGSMLLGLTGAVGGGMADQQWASQLYGQPRLQTATTQGQTP